MSNAIEDFNAGEEAREERIGSGVGDVTAQTLSIRMGGAGDVKAESVDITQGTARNVEATNVTLRQAGAQSVVAENLVIRQGGALRAQADHMEISQGGVAFAQTQATNLNASRVGFALSGGDVTMDQAAARVDAAGDGRLERQRTVTTGIDNRTSDSSWRWCSFGIGNGAR